MWNGVIVRVVRDVDVEDFFGGGIVIVGYAYPNGVRCVGLEIKNGSGLERTICFEREEGIATRAVSIRPVEALRDE